MAFGSVLGGPLCMETMGFWQAAFHKLAPPEDVAELSAEQKPSV